MYDLKLAPYIKAPPQWLAPEDEEYLRSKGAFTGPHESLRDEMLEAYTDFVNPFLPIVEIEEVLSYIHEDVSIPGISLPLFHAIMFTAAAYTNMDTLKKAGFGTRKEAQNTFFRRAKLLCNFGYEPDRIALIQTLLHLTFYNEQPGTNIEARLMLSAAINIARGLGLHCHLSYQSPDLQSYRLRKRLWWSCFNRDRLIALESRCPPMIREEQCAVPILSEADLEVKASAAVLGRYQILNDVHRRRLLAKLYVSLTKLCICMTTMLDNDKSHINQSMENPETRSLLSQHPYTESLCKAMLKSIALEEWLHEFLETTKAFASDLCESRLDNVIRLHQGLIRGVYFAAISLLHHVEVGLPPTTSSTLIALRRLSQSKLRNAANEITTIYRDFLNRGLLHFLPSTGVHIFLAAVTLHFHNLASSNPVLRREGYSEVKFSVRVLDCMKEMYHAADTAFQVVKCTIRKLEKASFGERAKEEVERRHGGYPGITITHAVDSYSDSASTSEAEQKESHGSYLSQLGSEYEQSLYGPATAGIASSISDVATVNSQSFALPELSFDGALAFMDASNAETPVTDIEACFDAFLDIRDVTSLSSSVSDAGECMNDSWRTDTEKSCTELIVG
jgi:Fungal specific transcription factor domain